MRWGNRKELLSASVAMVVAGGAACGGGSVVEGTGGSSSGTSTGTGGSAPLGMQCPPRPSDAEPWESEAEGTVTSSVPSAALCNVAAYLFVSRYTTPPDQLLLSLDSTTASAITFKSPAGASDGLLTGMISVSSPEPGVYKSSDGAACGFLGFSYGLPIPASVDCDGGTPPSCSPGCSSVCSGQGCEPCAPTQPQAFYGANAPTDCLGDSQVITGSWTLTLTSVSRFTGDAGELDTDYTPHGTLQATLTDVDGGTDPATLSMAF